MEKIDNEQFGQLLTELRKEKGLTQKQLAEKLYISDKAVSKWERGLSLPDISLLMPLTKIFGVTTTELLMGKRIKADVQFTAEEVETLMTKTIVLSKGEREEQNAAKKNRKLVFFACIAIAVLEILLLVFLGYTTDLIKENLQTVELMMLIFGIYFTFFVREALPGYYDENKISFFTDRFFRMNMAGIRFNNSNWKHIVKAVHTSGMGILILFPLLYLAVSYSFPVVWEDWKLFFTLSCLSGIVIPLYIAGKKYE